MYQILKNHITHSTFDLAKVLERIKSLHGRMEITDDQRDELEALAREKASFTGSLDTPDKLLELESRIRAIEEKLFSHDGEAEETYPEYVAGKWYYAGDKCSHNGMNYVCTAPAGVVCVWNPEEHPAYWQAE